MKKIIIEFCTGDKVEATDLMEGLEPVIDFFLTMPVSNEEKKRYMKEFDDKCAEALKNDSNEIFYDPFIRIRAVEA